MNLNPPSDQATNHVYKLQQEKKQFTGAPGVDVLSYSNFLTSFCSEHKTDALLHNIYTKPPGDKKCAAAR